MTEINKYVTKQKTSTETNTTNNKTTPPPNKKSKKSLSWKVLNYSLVHFSLFTYDLCPSSLLTEFGLLLKNLIRYNLCSSARTVTTTLPSCNCPSLHLSHFAVNGNYGVTASCKHRLEFVHKMNTQVKSIPFQQMYTSHAPTEQMQHCSIFVIGPEQNHPVSLTLVTVKNISCSQLLHSKTHLSCSRIIIHKHTSHLFTHLH